MIAATSNAQMVTYMQ